jgi:cytochrome c551/c552
MPAWEFRIAEDDLWSTVAFLRQMPFMTHEDYLEIEAGTAAIACSAPTRATDELSPDYAKVVFRQYACHACHRIEGVIGPNSRVGPPLIDWSRRKYVAGVLPNNEENLVRFIRDPQDVSPHSLMPKLDVAEVHAREMARYLLALE